MSGSQQKPERINIEDEYLSSSKVPPLESPTKTHVKHSDSQGVVGTDDVIESSRVSPFPHNPQKEGSEQSKDEQQKEKDQVKE